MPVPVPATVLPRPESIVHGQSPSMSEDRPAGDPGDGVDAAVELSHDMLADLVGRHRARLTPKPPRRLC